MGGLGSLNKVRILAVDDDAAMRDIYREAMSLLPPSSYEEGNFSLTLAKDGHETVEAVRKSVHDQEPFGGDSRGRCGGTGLFNQTTVRPYLPFPLDL